MIAAVALAAGAAPRRQRIVHDLADGARAAAAFGTASEAAIDLRGGARPRFGSMMHGRSHVMIGDHVAGTDDHGATTPGAIGTICNYC